MSIKQIPQAVVPASVGGMTLLSTTTLSGASTTISSINGSYNSLFAVVYGVTSSADCGITVRPNTSATGNAVGAEMVNGVAAQKFVDTTYLNLAPSLISSAQSANAWSITIDNYASSTNNKPYSANGVFRGGGANYGCAMNMSGGTATNTAITTLGFFTTTGTFSSGTVLLYGVK